MKQIILHIPHSSNHIPIKDGFIVDIESLNSEILKLTDWFTDEFFRVEDAIRIVAGFSRIFCDPERFTDDSQEIMAQYGMGVIYEKTDNGKIMRVITPELRENILKEYYWLHHNRLNAAVKDQLDQFGCALIIDCHSFPNIPFLRDLNKQPNSPDFNIGITEFHTPKNLIDFSVEFFTTKGFSVGINWPYQGTIVPLEYYQKNRNVHSIMLEINRKLYLNEPTNVKSERFVEIQKLIREFIEAVKIFVL